MSNEKVSVDEVADKNSVQDAGLRHSQIVTPKDNTLNADWKARHDTEQTMHNAWRKRAEEAELREAEYLRVLTLFAGGMNTSCADCEAVLGNRHSEQCLIWKTISGTQPTASASALSTTVPDHSPASQPESVSASSSDISLTLTEKGNE